MDDHCLNQLFQHFSLGQGRLRDVGRPQSADVCMGRIVGDEMIA
jgi:hypothetical protein